MAKKTLKKVFIGLAVVILLGLAIGYGGIQRLNRVARGVEINEIDLANVEDGVYIGDYGLMNIISATVKVTVADHRITNIELIDHEYGLGKKAETILGRIIDQQSLKVDVISGATGSSTVILKAIERALE
ncbi:FMN-binding protein [Alkaliphilus crotonatoxidans]